MRTTLNIDDDVFELARSLADARRVSIGRALSELARRGVKARRPSVSRSGFHVFAVEEAVSFGPDEVRAALEAEDLALANQFTKGLQK